MKFKSIYLIGLVLIFTGCSHMTTRERNMTAGAVIGGAAGAALTGGSGAGVAGGAAVGGIIGHEITPSRSRYHYNDY